LDNGIGSALVGEVDEEHESVECARAVHAILLVAESETQVDVVVGRQLAKGDAVSRSGGKQSGSYPEKCEAHGGNGLVLLLEFRVVMRSSQCLLICSWRLDANERRL
jgi:hypothetical protein